MLTKTKFMVTKTKGIIDTGTLVNWEGIAKDINSVELRGLSPDYRNERYKKELERRFDDFDFREITTEIVTSKCVFGGNTNPDIYECIIERLNYPFVRKKEITQMHEVVEELIGNKALLMDICNNLNIWNENEGILERQLYNEQIKFTDYEKKILENYSFIGKALSKSDSKLLKDLSNIFDSWSWIESPIGEYYNLVCSPNLKAKVDLNGFELFSENEDISVNPDKKYFTRNKKASEFCIKNSIQRGKAYKTLKVSKNLLDFLKSVSVWSKNSNFVRPLFNKEGNINIRQGYHPLLISKRRSTQGNPFLIMEARNTQYDCRKVVKHNTDIDKKIKVLGITGPNFAGKTTYIKELALISMLAQAGSFVPADSANLPIYNRFLSHFGSEDDIMNDISLYEAEIRDLNHNLNRLEDKTLLVCDELFRGTESGKKGGALLHKGVVESLVSDFPGRTILSSHYHESLAQQRSEPRIQFSRFELTKNGDPTYELLEGVDKGGYAVITARRAGLSLKVCNRIS